MAQTDIVTCPKCNFKFSKSYARITACSGCPMSVTACSMIKCPNCNDEFKAM
jgi:uncharacterized C2H2 Zn-finger protein